MNFEKLSSVATGVFRAHIEPLGFTFSVSPYYENSLVIEASRDGDKHLEHLRLSGMSEDVQAQYVHCRVHALAATILSRLHPDTGGK